MAEPSVDRVTLARILRPQGRKGEVATEILTSFPPRLTQLKSALLWDGETPPRPVRIRACRLHKKQAIFHFEGCDSISDAEKLAGWQVQVPLAERLPLAAGHYYVTDLVGCEVFERQGDAYAAQDAFEKLGLVREVQFTGEGAAGTPVLVVETGHGELLIPLATEICTRIEVAARRIEVALPEGLRELNQG